MHREVSLLTRLGTVLLIMGAVVAGLGIAVSTGAVKLPRLHPSDQSADASAAAEHTAAEHTAADRQWASALCTNLLGWKNEIKRDGTSLNLGLGPVARIKDAAAATTRMLDGLNKLGPPPAAQSAQARAEADELRAQISSRALNLEHDATSVASGNLAAIGALVADVGNAKSMGTEIGSQLQHVVSADLGLSLAETGACRQLVGIPV